MKAIILAAGYATRLYPLTRDRAKPLLPVGGRAMIDYIVEKVEAVEEIDTIYVVTNRKFYDDFVRWEGRLDCIKEVVVVNDGTSSDDDKLGAIGDIGFVIKEQDIDEELLIVGGDNLFDFNLRDLADFYKEKGNAVALYRMENLEDIKRYNEIRLDDEGRIISFIEKPSEPRSNLFAVCIYLFDREAVRLVQDYLQQRNNPDAPGFYIQWLHKKVPVYGFAFKGSWYDIGNLQTYREADKIYAELSQEEEI